MNPVLFHWLLFLAGVFVGSMLGILVAGLCSAAGQMDERLGIK